MVMARMRMVVRHGDTYWLAGINDQPAEDTLDEKAESQVETDEVLARILSRMDVFDNRMQHMESMMSDHFSSLDISYGSIDSRLDIMQNQYTGLNAQLQMIIHML
ncbi:hypothetical protein JCGZ_11270 [Jatropha curcas]|uniref:Uncharacterized protein n=1 Tax=Jatropha curcas TaxID=180498 RepID=A0A067KSG4_JATCU|nr:hypothetical protein JCGZ_11270 [Jatropha curcas]